jgi:hypothetical protein
VKADGQCTGECGGCDSDGFECHRHTSVTSRG